jgi:hypothetical protein
MSGQLDRIYKTKRDGGLTYSFHATWAPVPGGVNWKATVVHDRKVAGTPSGFVTGPAGPDFAEALEKILRHYIERQIDVR